MKKQSSRNILSSRQQFDLHYSLARKDKQYNALSDPHSNNFFISKAGKQRLRELKTEMRQQRSAQHKELLQLIKHKVKIELPKIKFPLLEGNSPSQTGREKQRMSDQIHSKIVMTERFSSHPNTQDRSQFVSSKQGGVKQQLNFSQLKTSGSKPKLKKSKVGSRPKVNHQDFVKFLASKKELLEKSSRLDCS